MAKQEVKQRIEKLKKLINRHRYLYHVLDRQEVSNDALDSLKHELYKLEQRFPELITPDSPSQRVAGQPLKEFKKKKHSLPMLSLEDVFSEKELQDWEKYLKRLAPSKVEGLEYLCELKVDGFAVELVYKDGILKTGSTRGDGLVGEDVTQNLKTIESIPLKLEYIELKILNSKFKIPKQLIVRGEVYMEKKDFEKFNQALIKKGEKPFANPRNLAAGSIRQLDPKLAASRPLKFLAYGIVSNIGQTKHFQEHQILASLGFRTDPGKICKNLSQVVAYWQRAAKEREALPFQIDGIVASVNQNHLFERLGFAGKSPRGARALKFSPKQATTRIKEIKVQVGRTGAITPIALLEPVEIDGVTITRATLHNEDEIKRLKIKIGDTVIVERAGDVIPDVAMVLPELRTGKEKAFHFPKTCPNCLTRLSKPLNGAVWRCPNQNCPIRKRKNLYYFVSKKAFNIEGLGPKITDKLISENLISQPADIFTLREGDLSPLEGLAEKSAENLVEAIKKSKKITLPRFIFALGIRQVGQETAVDLANYFGSLDNLKKIEKQDLEAVSDIGPKTAESIYIWFHDKQNIDLLEELERVGIEIENSKFKSRSLAKPSKARDESKALSELQNSKLKKKTFVLTGSLETITREQAKEKIRLLGGNVSEAVSKSTDYLVAGKKPGSKLDKARKLGIKIMDEEEFLNMIR